MKISSLLKTLLFITMFSLFLFFFFRLSSGKLLELEKDEGQKWVQEQIDELLAENFNIQRIRIESSSFSIDSMMIEGQYAGENFPSELTYKEGEKIKTAKLEKSFTQLNELTPDFVNTVRNLEELKEKIPNGYSYLGISAINVTGNKSDCSYKLFVTVHAKEKAATSPYIKKGRKSVAKHRTVARARGLNTQTIKYYETKISYHMVFIIDGQGIRMIKP